MNKLRLFNLLLLILTVSDSFAQSVTLVKGWNLLGNGLTSSITASTIGNSSQVTSIWKWDALNSKWNFYTPQQADGGAVYASTNGYGLLSVIKPGEGYWINAAQAFTTTTGTGVAYQSSNFNQGTVTGSLVTGWNLISVGDTVTPAQFNTNIGFTPPTAGTIPINLTSLWAWDAANSKWLFYAPSVEAKGTTALATYSTTNGYEDFTTKGATLGMGVGFWVNAPAPLITVTSASSSSTGGTTSGTSLQSQTITLIAPSAFVLNSAASLNVSASSGLTVGIVSATTSVCTVSGKIVTPIAVGTCTISLTQLGNTQYAAANPLNQNFSVISNIPPLAPVVPDFANLIMTVGNSTLAVGSTTTIHTVGVPPVITSGPTVSNIQSSTATVTWSTDKASVAGLSWNDGSNYGSQTDTTLATTHSKQITGLSAGATYTLTVSSTDASGNGPTLSAAKSFTTSSSTSEVSSVVPPDELTMANCDHSKHLIGAQDSKSWVTLALTTASNLPTCVSGFQDAGKYIVFATIGVSDNSGNICDLVVVTKLNGNTSCINLSLANRNLTGNPTFLLSSTGYLSGANGQLSANGKYFLTGFYTTKNDAAYIGFELLDFTGSTPVGKIVYEEYGTQVSNCAGTPSVNSHNIFWSSYWLQENSNFVMTQFNVSQCSATPATGSSKFYYIDSNNTTDPLNPIKYLFNINDVASSNGYGINATSPLNIWLAANIPSVNNWQFGSEILPGGSTSASDLSFYIVVGGAAGGASNNCTTGTGTSVYGVGSGINGQQLIKVVISNGNVSFQDYGSTNIGTGYGANPLTDNVYLTNDGLNLVSVHWTDDNGTMKLMQINRQLNASSCDVYKMLAPPNIVITPASLIGKIATVGSGNFIAHSFPYTYRSKDYIYMYGFNSNPGDPDCTATSGCQITTDTQIWAFNKTTNAISSVPITQLKGSTTFYSTETISNPLSNNITNTLLDSAGNKYWISLNTTGISNLIQFPSSFGITNGFISGSN